MLNGEEYDQACGLIWIFTVEFRHITMARPYARSVIENGKAVHEYLD